MTQITLYDPTGRTQIKQRHAPRLNSLDGKRIGFLTNEQWQAYFALPALKRQLEQDTPSIEALPIDRFPKGNSDIGSAETAALLKQSGVDAVIIGNAA